MLPLFEHIFLVLYGGILCSMLDLQKGMDPEYIRNLLSELKSYYI